MVLMETLAQSLVRFRDEWGGGRHRVLASSPLRKHQLVRVDYVFLEHFVYRSFSLAAVARR